MRIAAGLVAFAVALGWGAAARAEGPGFRFGDAQNWVLHLGVGLGAGYDSNVFYAAGTATDPARGAFYIAVRPAFEIATLPPQRGGSQFQALEFRLSAGLPVRALVSPDAQIYRHWSLGGEFALRVTRHFASADFDFFDNFVRTSQTPYSVVRAGFTETLGQNINNDANLVGMRLTVRPGGGRLEGSLQYTNGISYWEESLITAKSLMTNDFQLNVKWKFFPKTALYLNATETLNHYPFGNDANINRPPSAYPFRAVLGVLGLITAKLNIHVNVGYGNSFTQTNDFYKNNTSYSNVIALAELEWRPTVLTRLLLGYRHDFAQAVIGTYYILDNAYFSFDQQIWRFVANLRVGWEHCGFQGALLNDGLFDARVDDILAGHLQIDLPVKDFLTISIGDDITKNWSNCRFAGGFQGIGPVCDYFRNDAWLRLAFAY